MFSRKDAVGSAIIVFLMAVATGQVMQPACQVKAAQHDSSAKTSPPSGQQLLRGKDCFSCHAVDHKVVGPAYVDVARKYAGKPGAIDKLVRSIRDGEEGTWGTVPMTPHPGIPDPQLRAIAAWVLSLKNATPAASAVKTKQYAYELPDGTAVKLDFPIFTEGSSGKVTKEVFRGYELYNSYCYRCHGQDVTESELAPDLRHSLEDGMTPQQFMSVAMAGRDDKGMPGWAGFLTEDEMKDIFMYVDGRRLELVPVGRPPSEDQ